MKNMRVWALVALVAGLCVVVGCKGVFDAKVVGPFDEKPVAYDELELGRARSNAEAEKAEAIADAAARAELARLKVEAEAEHKPTFTPAELAAWEKKWAGRFAMVSTEREAKADVARAERASIEAQYQAAVKELERKRAERGAWWEIVESTITAGGLLTGTPWLGGLLSAVGVAITGGSVVKALDIKKKAVGVVDSFEALKVNPATKAKAEAFFSDAEIVGVLNEVQRKSGAKAFVNEVQDGKAVA